MKLLARFFELLPSGELAKVSQRKAELAWYGERAWEQSVDARKLEIVSVLCDEQLLPLRGFLLRLELRHGSITDESRRLVMEAINSLMPDLSSGRARFPTEAPLVRQLMSGWPEPEVLSKQLGVALDVPVRHIPDFYFGGPLVMCGKMQVSLQTAVSYYNTAQTREIAKRVRSGRQP